jgi:uncharacterized membrane protein (UPF0127 family)
MRKKWFVWIILIAVGIWIATLVLPSGGAFKKIQPEANRPAKYEPKFKYEGDLWVIQPETKDTLKALKIEFADTESKRQFGMMYRKQMDPETGMLFLMEYKRPQSFYMRNTYVPLDIIYIDDDFTVVSIQRNAEPLNTKSLPSEGPALYVLEVFGGEAEKIGIDKGTIIRWERL